MTDRVQAVDATEAMRRPHVIRKYGPGKDDRVPGGRGIRQSAAVVLIFGGTLLLAFWYFVARPLLPAVFDSPGLWVPVCLIVTFGAARFVGVKAVDGRSVPRVVRSGAAHAARTHGRYVGPWTVNGRPVKTGRRGPKTRKPVTVPYDEDDDEEGVS